MLNNMADLFGKINEFQGKMKETKEILAREEVHAEAGGGMVKVTANGNKEITKIELEKEIIDPADKEMMEDLIVAGVNKALAAAEEMSKTKMAEITKGMIPGGGIPGLDLSKFGL